MTNNVEPIINNALLTNLLQALNELEGWGSVEIFVQDGKVTQITKRAIKKTNYSLKVSLDK